MRENSRVRRQRSGLALGAKQVTVLLAAALAMLGGAFLAGVSVGRQATASVAVPVVATARAALDHLDDPPAPHDEAVPELKAPQVLTDARPIERTMPLAPAKLVPAPTPVATPTPTATPAATPTPTRAATPTPTATLTNAKAKGSATSGTRTAAVETTRPQPRGVYTIQVASSSNRADAERIARRLAGKDARIVTADVPGKGRCYRVQIGSFPTQEAARKQLPQLARAGLHGLVVTAPR